MLAKKRSALVALHEALREGQVRKHYLALVNGKWHNPRQSVKVNLRKYVLESGERRVSVEAEGQASHTIFELQKAWQEFSLLRAELKTGRTHQIRVHLATQGHPLLGDPVYGRGANRRGVSVQLAELTRELGRQALDAFVLGFDHPVRRERLRFEKEINIEIKELISKLELM